jgi:hypothetical protein
VAALHINVQSAPTVIDTYAPNPGDIILLVNQQNTNPQFASQNGPWAYNSPGTALSRPIWFSSGSTQVAQEITITNSSSGSATSGTTWLLEAPSGGLKVDSYYQVWSLVESGSFTPIETITSTTLTVTNPTGPSVELEIPSGTYAPANVTITSQSGTPYILALGDANTEIEFTDSGAVAVTVPTNASVAFPVGTVVNLSQMNTGRVTVAGAGGVTVNSPNGLITRVQYSTVSLIKDGTNTWVLSGDSAVS